MDPVIALALGGLLITIIGALGILIKGGADNRVKYDALLIEVKKNQEDNKEREKQNKLENENLIREMLKDVNAKLTAAEERERDRIKELATAQTSLSAQQKALDEANGRAREHDQQLSLLQAASKHKDDQLDAMNVHLNNLSETKSTVQTNLDQMTLERDNAWSALQGANQLLRDRELKISELTSLVEQHEKRIKDLEERWSQRESELNAAIARVASLQALLDAANARIAELTAGQAVPPDKIASVSTMLGGTPGVT